MTRLKVYHYYYYYYFQIIRHHGVVIQLINLDDDEICHHYQLSRRSCKKYFHRVLFELHKINHMIYLQKF